MVISKKLSKLNRNKLAAEREKQNKSSPKNLPKDQVFIVESILDVKSSRGNKQFRGDLKFNVVEHW